MSLIAQRLSSVSRARPVAAAGVVAGAAALWAWLGSVQTAHAARWLFEQLTSIHVIELAALLLVVGVGAMVLRGDPRLRRALAPVRGWIPARSLATPVPTVVVLAAIVSLVAVFRIALGIASTVPAVLGDELIYTGLAKSWALHGQPLLRGRRDVGDSLLYPLFLAPAYRVASTGAEAVSIAKVMNAIVVALAAVPAYFLARRVVSRSWSLGVAALTVAAPWTWYSAFVLTESLFYPVFVAFALLLAVTLEKPTRRRQLLLVGGLAVLCGIRAQALAVGSAVLLAIVLAGWFDRSLGTTVRRYAVTIGAIAVAVAIAAGLSAAGVQVPTGSYHVLFHSLDRIAAIAKWAAWNVGAFELGIGVVAVAAFPLALAGMLRRDASAPERSVGITAVALAVGILASVALLSASPSGLDILHERNLFYVAPLALVCLAHWLSHGMRRPVRLTAVVSAVAVLLPAVLPKRYVLVRVNSVDGPTMSFFRRLVDDAPGVDLRIWLVAIPLVAVGTLVLARRPLVPLLTVVLAFLAVTAANDQVGAFTPAQDRTLAWVDRALHDGDQATIVHVGYSGPPGSCPYNAALEQDTFSVWTEFFNTHVGAVTHVYDEIHTAGLASPKLDFGTGGLVVKDGQPYGPRYVVMDTRQPIVGQRLARLDLASLGSQFQNGASLTLWKVDPPLRFLVHAQPLPDRPDERPCLGSEGTP